MAEQLGNAGRKKGPFVKVIWSRLAIEELMAIHDYIANDKPSAARETAAKINYSVKLVCQFPSVGKAGRLQNTREYAIPKTSLTLIYTVREHQLLILRVFHGARRLP